MGSLLSYEQRLMLIEKSSPFDQKIAREYLNREDGILFYEKMPEANIVSARDMLSTQETVELIADFLLAYPPDLPNRQAQSIQNFYSTLMEKVKVLEGEC